MTLLLHCPLCQSDSIQLGRCFIGGKDGEQEAVLCENCGCRATLAAWNNRVVPGMPSLPKTDQDFTPDVARKIIAKYQQLIGYLTARKEAH